MVKKELTPLLRQYLEIKSEYHECLIFFRLGDFYELFFEDAEVAAKELDITLTKRGYLDGKEIPMCGVPFFQGEIYLARLLKKGFKVAICEQMESPEESKKRGHKEIIKRKVVRVATPGTLTEEKELETLENNFLASVISKEDIFSFAWIDISTGEVHLKECKNKKTALSRLQEMMPSELIYNEKYLDRSFLESLQKNLPTTLTLVSKDYYDYKDNYKEIINAFSNNKTFSVQRLSSLEVEVLGSLIKYISYTQDGKIPPIKIPYKEEEKKLLEIDISSKRNLEIINTLSGERKGSLFYAVNSTKTSAGSRTLINDLLFPLADLEKIIRRQDLVEFFFENYNFLKKTFAEKLSKIPDFSRSIIRLSLNRGGPRDLSNILRGLEKAMELIDLISDDKFIKLQSDTLSKLVQPIIKNKNIKDIKKSLFLALEDKLPLHARDGGFIKRGYQKEIDLIRDYRDNSKKIILDIEQKEKKLTQVNTLRIKYNNFLGYFIEVSPTNQRYIKDNPEKYIHRQTLKNSIRYTSRDLIDLSEKIINSNADLLEKEMNLYKNLVNLVLKNSQIILLISDIVARLDVSYSWAIYAKNSKSVKPIITEGNEYKIDEGRHPSVEKTHSHSFISNSCILNKNNNNIFKLITGPNMSGKSTYLRQNAIILIMAQSGGYCPAEKVRIGICDKLFCRVGSGDELAKGNSTFMVEMLETARILQNATNKSLVILDEIGRGTSTFDGMSIAWATIEFLIEKIQCKTLFATHYNELSVLKDKFKKLELNTFKVKEWKGDLIFLHEITDGVAASSYGIQVAKMAGIPDQLTRRATDILETLEIENNKRKITSNQLNIDYAKKTIPTEVHDIQEEIKSLKINQLSPIEALNILSSYKEKLSKFEIKVNEDE